VLAGCLGAALLPDCRDPTEITVVLSTDAKCADVSGTTIAVGQIGHLDDKPAAAETTRCESSGRIGSLVVVPSGGKDEEVAIRVVTGIGNKTPEACVDSGFVGGCIVARRSLRYLPHTPLVLPVKMSLDCVDVPCGETETCYKGQCVPANVDPNQCVSGDCQPPEPDAGADAGSDVSADVGSGGSSGAGGSAGAAGQAGSAGQAGQQGDAAIDAPNCTSPLADCNGQAADGCETDTSTDAKNCGSCAHDCLGGNCTAGTCGAVTLWTAPTATPTRLALDATDIYFVDFNGGSIRRMPKSGGTPVVLATGQAANRIAIDATDVYWTDATKKMVMKVPKAGGNAVTLATLSGAPLGIGVDANNVYVCDQSVNGHIQSIPKGGGTSTAIAAVPWPEELVIHSGYVYVTEVTNNGELVRVPVGGGATETLDTNLSNGDGITADSTSVYFTLLGNGQKGQVLSLSLGGGTHTVLASAQSGPRGIAVDATDVYFTNASAGTVNRLKIDGSDNGVPVVLDSAGVEPLGLELDQQAIYWADDKAHVLMKLAK
jgi:sugar lactone lactonase YvrE